MHGITSMECRVATGAVTVCFQPRGMRNVYNISPLIASQRYPFRRCRPPADTDHGFQGVTNCRSSGGAYSPADDFHPSDAAAISFQPPPFANEVSPCRNAPTR